MSDNSESSELPKNIVNHKFSIYFDTKETTDHTMGAAELGAALIGLDQTIEEANKLINGENSSVDIKVSAPTPGSIGVPFDVTAFASTVDVITLLGLSAASGIVSASAIEVISFLKGRKIQTVVRKNDGKSTITVKSGNSEESYEIDTNVEKIVTNNDVRDKINDTFFKPVQGLTNPKILIKDFEGSKILTEIKSDEIANFKKLPSMTMVETEDFTKKVHVRFLKIDFEKESGWVIDYLGERLTVTIRDNIFMNRNKNNEQGFKSGDLFEVDLNTIIKTHPDKTLPARYFIRKVHKKIG
jgi:hypothetical protein